MLVSHILGEVITLTLGPLSKQDLQDVQTKHIQREAQVWVVLGGVFFLPVDLVAACRETAHSSTFSGKYASFSNKRPWEGKKGLLAGVPRAQCSLGDLAAWRGAGSEQQLCLRWCVAEAAGFACRPRVHAAPLCTASLALASSHPHPHALLSLQPELPFSGAAGWGSYLLKGSARQFYGASSVFSRHLERCFGWNRKNAEPWPAAPSTHTVPLWGNPSWLGSGWQEQRQPLALSLSAGM